MQIDEMTSYTESNDIAIVIFVTHTFSLFLSIYTESKTINIGIFADF